MGLLVSGFPGIGKTHYYNHARWRVLDSDSSLFSWMGSGANKIRNPSFPKNYVDHIKDALDTVDVILVSTHKTVRDALTEAKLTFTLVYPEAHLKHEYLQRFRDRGSDDKFIAMLDSNWDTFMSELEEQQDCKHVRLKYGEYLGDCEWLK